jgi:hypothetical protein
MIITKIKKQFNTGCQDPRNYASQQQMDEKHKQRNWAEGWVEKVSKLDISKESTLIF